jgi:hypothetical protein
MGRCLALFPLIQHRVGKDIDYRSTSFASSFENKKSAIETVTPMMDKDGTWRVSGYFIK